MIIIALSFSLYACVNKEFEKDFQYAIQSVNEYDLYRGYFHESIVGRFYFSTEYLGKLTGIEANFMFAEVVPYYSNREDCLNDIKKWEKWYNQNKYRVTKEQSDSIKKSVWSSHVWW
jgi:hypothetical protein